MVLSGRASSNLAPSTMSNYLILGKVVGRYEIDLLESAGAIACNAKGSSELYGDKAEWHRQALRSRLSDWQPSVDWERDYDDAVKALCEKALALDEWSRTR